MLKILAKYFKVSSDFLLGIEDWNSLSFSLNLLTKMFVYVIYYMQ
jgi:hypothetical protein